MEKRCTWALFLREEAMFKRIILWGSALLMAAVVGGLMAAAPAAQAKELTSRLGVGYSNNFGAVDNLPSLAVRYFPNENYGLSGALGIDTEKDNSKFGAMLRLMRIVFREQNMNFFVSGGGALISREVAGKNDSGFEAMGTFGGEFFFAGLDSLSFTFEAGIGITSISDQVRFRTIGDHPLRAGILFYF